MLDENARPPGKIRPVSEPLSPGDAPRTAGRGTCLACGYVPPRTAPRKAAVGPGHGCLDQ